MTLNEKECPFCGEIIKFNAIKCKHCKSILNETSSSTSIQCPYCKKYTEKAKRCLHCHYLLIQNESNNISLNSNKINKPRKPWVAVLLSIFMVGGGHIYCGKALRGFILILIEIFLCFLSWFLFSLPIFLFEKIPLGILVSLVIFLIYFLFYTIDSYRLAKSKKDQYSLKKYNKWYIYIFCYFLIAGFLNLSILITQNYISQNLKIPSSSMMDSLNKGDFVISNNFLYRFKKIKRTDIAVFKFPKDRSLLYTGRVVGVPGDIIEIKDKNVFINGKIFEEKYVIRTDNNIIPAEHSPRDNYGPVKVPENNFFVMGDNRDNSFDSRFWGFVDISDIKGKLIYVYWSWDSEKSNVRWKNIGKLL